MQSKFALAAVVIGLFVGPALAQTGTPRNETRPAGEELSRAECEANFKVADKDGNGTLSAAEVDDADNVIPTALGLTGPITHSEYMAACLGNVPKGG